MPDILVVDDNDLWRNRLKDDLEDEGYHVVTATNLDEAKAQLGQQHFFVVTIDLNLDESHDEIEGESLLRHIRRRYPQVRCLVVSGSLLEPPRVRDILIKYGAEDFIGKGRHYKTDSFLDVVAEVYKKAKKDYQATAQSGTAVNRLHVRNLLVTHFNEGELRDLCFSSGINYESLPGRSIEEKAIELVTYFERHRNLNDLIVWGQQLRPHINWYK